jgi:hypothetical protein
VNSDNINNGTRRLTHQSGDKSLRCLVRAKKTLEARSIKFCHKEYANSSDVSVGNSRLIIIDNLEEYAVVSLSTLRRELSISTIS